MTTGPDNRSPWFRLVDMDVDLREAFDQGFGPEPAHRPGRRAGRGRASGRTPAARGRHGPHRRRRDGRRARRGGRARRRPRRPGQVADRPDRQPDRATVWDRADEPARYTDDGVLEIRPGATVLRARRRPAGRPEPDHHSVALAVELPGSASTWLIARPGRDRRRRRHALPVVTAPSEPGSRSRTGSPARRDRRADRRTTTSALRAGRLAGRRARRRRRSSSNAHPVDLKDFVLSGEPTAAALLQGLEARSGTSLARDIDGVEVIAVPFRTGGDDLDASWTTPARCTPSGAGLR